jgi:hypothetical protein
MRKPDPTKKESGHPITGCEQTGPAEPLSPHPPETPFPAGRDRIIRKHASEQAPRLQGVLNMLK